jgi:ribosomal protein S12 methylthiotransferase accessory factor YcaO
MEEFEKLVAESFQGELIPTEERLPVADSQLPVEPIDTEQTQEIIESAEQKNSA